MKKIWKWILGILIVLVVLSAIGAIVFFAVTPWRGAGWRTEAKTVQPWGNERDMPWRGMPQQGMPWQNMPRNYGHMMPYNRGGMYGPGFGGFFPFGMIFGSLISLGFLVLVVLGIVFLVRSLRRPRQLVEAPASISTPIQVTTHPCTNCERPVQDDWSHCPYCGTTLVPSEPDSPQAEA
jgi:hypothetical protein